MQKKQSILLLPLGSTNVILYCLDTSTNYSLSRMQPEYFLKDLFTSLVDYKILLFFFIHPACFKQQFAGISLVARIMQITAGAELFPTKPHSYGTAIQLVYRTLPFIEVKPFLPLHVQQLYYQVKAQLWGFIIIPCPVKLGCCQQLK